MQHDTQKLKNQKDIVLKFLQACFSSPGQFKNYCCNDVKLYWREKVLISGIDELENFADQQHACFPDLKFEIKDILAEDNRVAVRLIQHGAMQSDWEGIFVPGALFSVAETMFFHFRDNLIDSVWPLVDIEDKKNQLLTKA